VEILSKIKNFVPKAMEFSTPSHRIEAMVYGTYTDIDENCRCERNFNVSGGSQATQDAIQDL
jgi:hypothetical protein